MSSLSRSSPLVGGKTISSAEWLCDYAADFFFELTGYNMEDFL